VARYRVTSERLVLAPLGDLVEIEDSVLAARLLAGGHIEKVSAVRSGKGKGAGATTGAAPDSQDESE
jgi:hypothetical protein